MLKYKNSGENRKNMKKGIVWMSETIVWIAITATLVLILLFIVFKITKSVGG